MAMRKKNKLLYALLLAAVTVCLALIILARLGVIGAVTLRFDVGGEITELKARRGESVDVSALVEPAAGERFVCWLDEAGNEADPGAPASGDASYTALMAPELAENMTPWLERDELGRLLPEAEVTGAELARGVSALFALAWDVSALAGLETDSASQLASALEGGFAPSELAGISGDAPLTRIEAAALLADLGGCACAAPASAPAPDLAADTPGAAELAASAAGDWEYTPGPLIADGGLYYVDGDGLFVTDTELGGVYFGADGRCTTEDFGSGFVNIAGYLYYVDESGGFVTDEEVDGIRLGADGRYTSGNAELDALVAEVLIVICEENGTREEMLRAAYDYARDSFEYLRRNYYSIGETGWETDEAYTMLTTGRGNCYNYAAAFWALARGLGYDARAVAGTMGWDYEPHAWVDIDDAEGNRLTYDCETEMAYRRDGEYGKDMFAMSRWFAAGWNYYYGV